MEFRILGRRLEVVADSGMPISIPRDQVRAATCMFALHAGSALSSREITDLLWDDPCVGGDAIRKLVHRVRRSLGGNDRIETTNGAYRLRLAQGDVLDVNRFRELHGSGVAAAEMGDHVLAASLLEQALAPWGEPPLGDLPQTTAMVGLAKGLTDEHLSAHEALVRSRLALGQHKELLPELRRWATQDPFNEQVRSLLMLALYRCGRTAQALEVFNDSRHELSQMGIAPGSDLRQMRDRVQAGDPDLAAPRPPVGIAHSGQAGEPVRQLPSDMTDFIGRECECVDLVGVLTPQPGAIGVPLAQITGPPGVGKSSLAIRVAHAVSDHYPDGQLYLRLAGASSSPRDPGVVLGEVLRALGTPLHAIPDTVEERAALYRSRLAGTKTLVVVDDAADPDQVRPLLPGDDGCAIIVTSRTQLTGLAGGHLLNLAPLSRDEARCLLTRILDPPRIAAEPHATDDLVRASGGLPLAIRIIGARLAARPAWPLAHMADLLRLRRRRLTELTTGDLEVRASIAASYEPLDATTARGFRLLSLLGPHDFAPWTLSILLGTDRVESLVERLASRSLLADAGVDSLGQPRYQMHDLIRDFAYERLTEGSELEVAQYRLLMGSIHLADRADARLPREPHFPAPGRLREETVPVVMPDACAWLDSERHLLLETARIGCAAGQYQLAYALGLRLSAYLHLRGHHDEAEDLWSTIAQAADSACDVRLAAEARLRTAIVTGAVRGRPAQALPLLDDCIRTFELKQERHALARALAFRAWCTQSLGRNEASHRDAQQGLRLAREIDDQHAEFSCLHSLGLALGQIGSHQEAIDHCEEALAIAEHLSEPSYQCHAHWGLVRVLVLAGRYRAAQVLGERGLKQAERLGRDLSVARLSEQIGDALRGQGCYEQAISYLNRAIIVFEDHRADIPAALCRLKLADAFKATGKPVDARHHMERSHHVFESAGMRQQLREVERELRLSGAPLGEQDQSATPTELAEPRGSTVA